MFGRRQFSHWLIALGLLVAVEGVTVLTVELVSIAPAQAQIFDDRYPFLRRQRQRQRSHGGGLFENLFGGFHERSRQRAPAKVQQPHVDYSRAPPPPKPDKNAEPITPITTIVVMGDGMAGWLAYGLEDAFSDSPEVAIVRKEKRHSGLIRYQWKSDQDWWHVARDDLKDQPANYVVMMLGVNDRRNISEKEVAKQAEKEKKDQNAAQQNQDQADNADQAPVAAPKRKYPRGIIPFRSDRWAKIYSHRIDATIAALKSKGVPVFWVGLPSIRGSRSTANAVYLNDLYRAAAERSGIKYIDIWDGFVDDGGKYSSYGPDYEGQTRRLRSADGVYFTKYGARKLAHYVEREIRRYMNNRTVVSLPVGPIGPVPGLGKSKERPLAGPVVPLTVVPGNVDTLAGAPGMRASYGDAIASEVLVKGDALKAPLGRADDFAWPPGSDANKKPAETSATKPDASVANAAPAAAAPPAKHPVRVIVPGAPAPAAKPAPPLPPPAPIVKREGTRQPAQARKPAEAKPTEARKPAEPKPATAEQTAQSRAPQSAPRLPQPIQPRPVHRPARRDSNRLFGPHGLFGWIHH